MLVQSESYKNYNINIFIDESPESPRTWCNLGTIYSNCRNLHADGLSVDDMEDAFKEDGTFKKSFLKNNILLPIYFYAHSGFSLFTESEKSGLCTHFRWDGGLFGFIVCSRENARKELNLKRLNRENVEMIKSCLTSEIDVYNRYVNGEVYGYQIEDENGEYVDSCWGFFDDPEYIIERVKQDIDGWNKAA